jgi:hypothetical protein
VELGNLDRLRSRKTRRWLIGLGLCLILGALRLPWRNADGGNWAYWSYAFFVTDEQLYTDGGRVAVLTSRFLDPEMSEPPSFLGSWGMHFLSYLGYRLDGLTLSAERWPSMLLAIMGWLAAYVVVSRRTSEVLAGIVVLLISCNPASLTYERVASTDVVIGALVVMAYALVTSRALWKTGLGGVCMAYALTVKPTAFPFLILFGLAVLARSEQRWRRLTCALASLFVCFGILWAARQACLHAVMRDLDPATVTYEARRGSSLLDNLDYSLSHWLKSYSIFPRWPIAPQLGLLAIGLFALPIWLLGLHWHRTGKLFSPRTVAAWGLLFYLLPLGTQFQSPLRYFLAATFFLPEILVISRTAGRYLRQPRPMAYWLLGGVVLALFALYWVKQSGAASPDLFQAHLYNDFTLPAHSAWGVLGVRLGIGIVFVAVAVGLILLRQSTRPAWPATLGLALAFSWMFFNSYSISLLTKSGEFIRNHLLLQVGLAVALASLVCLRARRWQTWYFIWAACFFVFVCANTYWRTAYRDLWTRQFYVRDASRQLTSILPPNSIVIGRRAPLLLRNTPIRVGLGSFAYSSEEFLGRVRRLLDRYPERPLYWLIDGDGCPTWNYYQQETNRDWTVKLIINLFIPSGDTLEMMAVEGNKLPLVPIQLLRVTKQAN